MFRKLYLSWILELLQDIKNSIYPESGINLGYKKADDVLVLT